MPSNTLAVLYGLAQDCRERRVLGTDVDIDISAIDETNTRVRIDSLIRKLRADFTLLGGTLDPHAAFLLQRGLKTYHLRYAAQCATAQQVAEFLAAHAAVARVHYPGLPSHPRHALAREQMCDFGAIVSFDLRAGAAAGDRFADALELFSITSSLGSTESLVIPPGLMSTQDLPRELVDRCGIAPGTVRLSIGLDDPADLFHDLARALEVACSEPSGP